MRLAAAAFFVWAFGPAITFADTATLVSQVYDRFTQSCALAFTNPQAYVGALPQTNSAGQPTVSVSPDGKVVKTYATRDGLTEDATFARHPNQLLATCIVMPSVGHTDTARMMQMMSSPDGIQRYSEDLARAVQTIIPAKSGGALVGGRTPVYYSHEIVGEPLTQVEQSTYHYSFILDAGGAQVPSVVAVQHGGLSIYSAHSIKVSQ